MTTTHPLGLAVRSAINKVAYAGDFTEMEALVAEDAVLYAHCGGAMGGIHRGRDNCLNNFKNLSAFVNGSLRLDVVEIMADDSFVVMLNSATARRERELLTEEIEIVDIDQMIAVIWRFENGQCVEFFDHFSDPESWDAFWRFDRMPDRSDRADSDLTREQVRDLVERMSNTGEDELLRSVFTAHVVSSVDGRSPIGGVAIGPDAVLRGLAQLRELADGTLRVTAETVLVAANLVTFFARVTATRNGRSIEQVLNTTWRFDRGRVAEVFVHFADVTAWDAFWRADG
ncbi:nuclear transport factor 2 family protein [Microbacterium sp. ARD31]|uniref:nuclear transport factor 2 family protein n=1 Tax=Microbacterium sp. ARD31 TaxID=2962576 RepID=UPI002880E213|nr:nuclear transport factor 2 family protein [Microbacterium sp. ARD31]MDT0184002.1 nuclear transport factor 2 family protein [Microbacterium sp. ARD31]